MKIFIYPPNSLILSDLVERYGAQYGHEPLVLMSAIGERVTNPDLDSPPLNITEEELKKGLHYVAIEAPSGIRGRMGVIGPLIDQAEAAIIIEDENINFGCLGCARAANYIKYLVKKKDIPIISIKYPTDETSAKLMVKQIKNFLENLS
ncbi:MAG: methanogenesis marker 5 protein [Candidatus Helarchaeota archaeon]|nr:methanogenesis marker 5 protein [Candidatus Helarchaeota archaeon]